MVPLRTGPRLGNVAFVTSTGPLPRGMECSRPGRLSLGPGGTLATVRGGMKAIDPVVLVACGATRDAASPPCGSPITSGWRGR